MSKFDECMEDYRGALKQMGVSFNDESLAAVAKSLGPSIYNDDASTVSSSDKEELERVKNNFLIGKLELADSPALDAAIAAVVDQFGSSNRNKYRAVFYYLLAEKFGKLGNYA